MVTGRPQRPLRAGCGLFWAGIPGTAFGVRV